MRVSYAQNFEDVMLWRALGHVKNGYYVDIGAQDPRVDSVSRMFYESGWRGMHVEPTPHYADRLRQDRPDEVVVQALVSDVESDAIKLFEFPDTGLSTLDAMIAEGHIARGIAHIEREVSVVSLAALLRQAASQEIHWMKIDVEGAEQAVLSSWGDSLERPWLLVIESTLPLSQELSHDKWEWLVLERGYRFAYFDGLNRFYVHQSHAELFSAFIAPPNVFDGFVFSGLASNAYSKDFSERLARLQASVDLLGRENARREAALAEARNRLIETQRNWQRSRREFDWQRERLGGIRVRADALAAKLWASNMRLEEVEATLVQARAEVAMFKSSTYWRVRTQVRVLMALAARCASTAKTFLATRWSHADAPEKPKVRPDMALATNEIGSIDLMPVPPVNYSASRVFQRILLMLRQQGQPSPLTGLPPLSSQGQDAKRTYFSSLLVRQGMGKKNSRIKED